MLSVPAANSASRRAVFESNHPPASAGVKCVIDHVATLKRKPFPLRPGFKLTASGYYFESGVGVRPLTLLETRPDFSYIPAKAFVRHVILVCAATGQIYPFGVGDAFEIMSDVMEVRRVSYEFGYEHRATIHAEAASGSSEQTAESDRVSRVAACYFMPYEVPEHPVLKPGKVPSSMFNFKAITTTTQAQTWSSSAASRDFKFCQNYKRKPVLPIGTHRVFLCSFKYPWDMSFHLAKDHLASLDIDYLLSDYCNDNPPNIPGIPKDGLPCAARYSWDKSWYRGEVMYANNDMALVRFVDYGNVQDYPSGVLKFLPLEFGEQVPLGYDCKLEGFPFTKMPSSYDERAVRKWRSAIEKIQEEREWMVVEVLERVESGPLTIRLLHPITEAPIRVEDFADSASVDVNP